LLAANYGNMGSTQRSKTRSKDVKPVSRQAPVKPEAAPSFRRIGLVVAAIAIAIALGIRVWHDRGGARKATLAELEQRAHSHPEDEQAQLDLGNALLNLHRDQEAEPVLKAAATLSPSDPLPLDALAVVAADQNRPGRAIRYLRQSVRLNPNDSNAWRSLGRLLEHVDAKLAMQALARATELNPKDAVAWRELGNTERDLGRYGVGIEHLQRAFALAPNDLETANRLGDTALAYGSFVVAKQAYDHALALAPNDPQALLGSAHLTLQTDPSPSGIAQAGSQIDRAIAIQRTPTAYAHLVRGRYNMVRHNYRQAIPDLKAAVQMDPHIGIAHSYLSQVYAALGQAELARKESALFDIDRHVASPSESGPSSQGAGR